MTRLAFVDTETTSTDPVLGEVWEAAVITAAHDGGKLLIEDEWSGIRPARNLRDAEPNALHMNNYYERVELAGVNINIVYEVATRTAGCELVGANVAFDAAFLDAMLQRDGYRHAWGYSPIDVKALAMGRLAEAAPVKTAKLAELLSGMRNVDLTEGLTAHTALDDARLAMRMYAAVYGLTIEPCVIDAEIVDDTAS